MKSEGVLALVQSIGPLNQLEETVVRNVFEGRLTTVGDGRRPTSELPSEAIRAEVLNHLFRYGISNGLVTDFGIQIKGATILGELNLSGCVLPYGIRLINCSFDKRIYGPSVKVDRLNLQGSELAGLYLERAKIAGYLLCNRGFVCNGRVTLIGSKVDGTVSFDRATIISDEPIAIHALRCKARDSMFFSNGFTANGRIVLLGAEIGGQLTFSNSRIHCDSGKVINAQRAQVAESLFIHKRSVFKGEVKLTGIDIGGQAILRDFSVVPNLTNPGTLSLDNARIGNGLVLKGVDATDEIDVSQTITASLNDDYETWEKAKGYNIEGFNYRRLLSEAYDIHKRLKWIESSRHAGTAPEGGSTEKAYSSDKFTPQPFQQLAQVVGEMGHRKDRSKVLYNMERQLRKWQAREMRLKSDRSLDGSWKAGFTSLFDELRLAAFGVSSGLLRLIVGYGYKPENSLICALAVIGATTVVVNQAYLQGDFTPTAAPVLVSERWQSLAAPIELGGHANPAEVWGTRLEEGRDYSTFNALYYSADLFVPLVDFGQDSDWAPSTTRSEWGRVLHWSEPVIRLIGWVVSALGAAAIAGIVRNE